MSCSECHDLKLELAAVRMERDLLLAQRTATQEWMGVAIHGSPIDPASGLPDPNRALADRLVAQYPEKKIQAIKDLRTQSAPDKHGRLLGLKEAKDYIDAAYTRAALKQNLTP